MVVIGGFSGINTALELAEHGITDIVVLEARHLGFGGTGRNGGQIMAGIGHDLEDPQGRRRGRPAGDLRDQRPRRRHHQGPHREYAIDADFCHGYGYMGFNARQKDSVFIMDFRAARGTCSVALGKKLLRRGRIRL